MEMSAENMIFVWHSKCRGCLPSAAVKLVVPFHDSWVSSHATACGSHETSPNTSYSCPLHRFTGTPFSVNVDLAEIHCLLRFTPCYPCTTLDTLHIHVFSIITNTACFFHICHSHWEAAIGLPAQMNKSWQISSVSIHTGTPLDVFSSMQIVFITSHECPSSHVLCFLPLWLFIGSSVFFFRPLFCLSKQTNILLIVPD